MEKMTAIQVYEPNKIRYVEQEVFKPGYGEVLIKVRAAGMCGTDPEILTCKNTYYRDGRAKLPIIPGHEWSGEIVELGEGVENFKPAGRIVLIAFHEQYAHLDWREFANQEIDIIGSCGSPGVWPAVIDLVDNRKVDVNGIISHRLPLDSLESFEEALDIMKTRRDNACKILLHPWKEEE